MITGIEYKVVEVFEDAYGDSEPVSQLFNKEVNSLVSKGWYILPETFRVLQRGGTSVKSMVILMAKDLTA